MAAVVTVRYLSRIRLQALRLEQKRYGAVNGMLFHLNLPIADVISHKLTCLSSRGSWLHDVTVTSCALVTMPHSTAAN